jgi:hypothetical protein
VQKYRASLQGAGNTLLDAITVYVEEGTEPSGLHTWYGVFQVPAELVIEPGGPYRLRLDDGRAGDIIVNNVSISSTAPAQVSFVGSGPLS